MFGGRENSCIYAWTRMQRKGRKQDGKRKKEAIKLLDCHGIFSTREKEESRETGITFASIIILR